MKAWWAKDRNGGAPSQ